jgi:putative ABC transport system permease protein
LGGATRTGWRLWRSPLWRKAPVVLLRHRSALAAMVVAGFLVALAASSAPFVTTASASAELKANLSDLSPLATGLVVTSLTRGVGSVAALTGEADRRERALRTVTDRFRLDPPVFTLESQLPFSVTTGAGDERVLLMSRTNVLRHIRKLATVPGAGVWVSDLTARDAHVRPGGTIRLASATQEVSRVLRLRVKGIYRALDRSAPGAYWANFLAEILPPGADPPPPARYIFMSRDALLGATRRLASTRTIRVQGRTYHEHLGIEVISITEMAVAPGGLTLARARALAHRFGVFRRELKTSSLGRVLDCGGPRVFVAPGPPPVSRCSVSSSLSSAVALANRDASEISPGVSLLAGAGTAIALAVAGAAGVFLVRRRSVEAALLYARGEHVASFVTRSALELLLPVALGAAAGFAVALALTGSFAPTGSIDRETVHTALSHAAVAAAAALALAAGAAGVVYVRQFDSGTRRHAWARRVPWELPLLAAGFWLLAEVLSGRGLASSGAAAAGHPTLAVFVFPLLLVAGAAGLAMRALRPLLRSRPGRGAGLPDTAFLAFRRLSAARGLLTALFVVSAVAFGAYFYAQALAGSLSRNVAEKAYIAYGGDAQALSPGGPLPKRFPYPLTEVEYGNQAATIDASGTAADVLAVDPGTLGAVLRWYPDWGRDPRPLLGSLDGGGRTLPAIATRSVPAGTAAISLAGARVPIHVVARVSAFPGMSAGTPLLVVSRTALAARARRLHVYAPLGNPQVYLWAKGPPAETARALAAPAVGGYFVTSVDAFRKNPDVLLARRTFSYMRLIAVAAGVLVFIGLLLYLQARQRTQAVGSALAVRMGLKRRTEIASLALELAAIALGAAVVGGVVALAAAVPLVRHLDPLPDNPPAPALAIPFGAVVLAAAALLVLALAAGVLTSRLARRTDMSEALRVA